MSVGRKRTVFPRYSHVTYTRLDQLYFSFRLRNDGCWDWASYGGPGDGLGHLDEGITPVMLAEQLIAWINGQIPERTDATQ